MFFSLSSFSPLKTSSEAVPDGPVEQTATTAVLVLGRSSDGQRHVHNTGDGQAWVVGPQALSKVILRSQSKIEPY